MVQPLRPGRLWAAIREQTAVDNGVHDLGPDCRDARLRHDLGRSAARPGRPSLGIDRSATAPGGLPGAAGNTFPEPPARLLPTLGRPQNPTAHQRARHERTVTVTRRLAATLGLRGLAGHEQNGPIQTDLRWRSAILKRGVLAGAPGRIRTCDRLLRRQLLCPAELQAPESAIVHA